MRARRLVLVSWLAAVASAAPATIPDQVLPAVRDATTLMTNRDCPGVLAKLAPIMPLITAPERGTLQRMRLGCMMQLGQLNDAAPVHAELAAAGVRDTMVMLFPVTRALVDRKYVQAADALNSVATTQPAALNGMNSAMWRAISAGLGQAGEDERRDRLGLALARANWQPPDGTDLRGELALASVRALVVQGRAAEAEPFVAGIENPDQLAEMLTLRRFEPLWPAIGRRMGPQGAQAIDRYAASRLNAFAIASADPAARREAVVAFLLLGRMDDAAALGGQVAIAPAMPEADVATILQQIRALIASGRRAAAVERLRMLAAQDARAGAVEGGILLAEQLYESGDGAGALAVSRATLAKGGTDLSPLGGAWLRRSELCGLTIVGPADEARAVGDALRDRAADNPAAAIEGLLCAAREDEAARIAVATLATPAGAAALSSQFQPAGAFAATGGASRLRDLWAKLLTRPEVKAAFERSARILPRALWPSPQPRPLPGGRGGLGTT